ncbi:uncharacterized protein LOC134291471 [Aedes albopictus]|uniref:GIY-YIG domain-containing protein n=1 Tax=Aedes albopictus TaxID=7160 RepID=A0ABM1ZEC4_AEDAL
MHLVREVAEKYGSHTADVLQRFQRTSIKLAKSSNHIKFLLNCRKCKVIPVCLNYKVHVNLENEESYRQMEKVLTKQKIRLISELIADGKRTVARTKKAKTDLRNTLERLLEREDFVRAKKMVEDKTVRVYATTKDKEIKKLECLKRKRVAELSYEAEWVENTTEAAIPDYLERTLMLGPNYNVPNRGNFPYIETVAEIDRAIKNKDNVEEIRAEVATAMSNFINYNNQPRHHQQEWIAKDVGRSRKFLKEHPNILLTKADKGNKTVILSSEEYEEKMEGMLQDAETYEKIRFDPTARIARKIKSILDGWKDRRYIDSRTHRRLNVSNCHPPRIYGLPKIHKQGRPLRPVVSTIGSTTYKLAQYLSDILGKIVGKTEAHVVNSFTFASEVSGTQISEDETMFSLDVTSLYTNVPVDYAFRVTSASRWAPPLSPVVANLVMERLEQESMRKLENKQITMKVYRRYVDDCFCIAKHEHIETIVETFNEFHEKLQFTVEREENRKLKFLDMTLHKQNGKIVKVWTPKQANGRYLDFNSESPFQHKRNTAIALIDRAIKLTDAEERHNTININRSTLQQPTRKGGEKGDKVRVNAVYPGLSEKLSKLLNKHGISLAYQTRDKIKNTVFSRLKDPIPKQKTKNVVYAVPCGTNDGKVYVGQTGRMLETRINEHRTNIRKKEAKTGLTQHHIDEGHNFNFNKTEILEKIENQASRTIAEAFHIKLLGEARTVNMQRECGGSTRLTTA